jgi:hypothetical protein
MVQVSLDPDLDSLLSQIASDLEIPRNEVAKIMLESHLVMTLSR